MKEKSVITTTLHGLTKHKPPKNNLISSFSKEMWWVLRFQQSLYNISDGFLSSTVGVLVDLKQIIESKSG